MSKNTTIILNKEDVNNLLHLHLWENFCEMVGIPIDSTEMELNLSSLDKNKKVDEDGNMSIFVNQLMLITKVSRFYANAAWNTISDDAKEQPYAEASNYKERFGL